MFTQVEDTLWYYGPWFHMLISAVQSLGFGEHWDVRHALTFLCGLSGIALLLPMARLAIGRWAGLAAVTLCLTAGYLYGSLFFTPIDVPFLFAMTAATLSVMVMARRTIPTWPATLAAGLCTGLALATRSSGLITQAYLFGAMGLCAMEIVLRGGTPLRDLVRLIGRTIAAILIGWIVAYCLWPWLQIGNPFTQFVEAFRYFANHPSSWPLPYWGGTVISNHLPPTYVPGELAARLPESFLLLLVAGLLIGIVSAALQFSATMRGPLDLKRQRLAVAQLVSPQARQMLILWAAALLPLLFIMMDGSTLYNGVRHVLFLIPMLALIAGYGFVGILPWLARIPVVSGIGIGGYLGYQIYILAALHPLEYILFNAFAGGVSGAYQRFEMDYWAAAAKVALRRLEQRVSYEPAVAQASPPPKLLICIAWREWAVEPMYGRPWTMTTKVEEADYVIATETESDCTKGQPFVPIDEVKRFGRAFAWTYARVPAAAPQPAAPAQ
jgi:hypothetical protein